MRASLFLLFFLYLSGNIFAQILLHSEYDQGFLNNPAFCGQTGKCILRAGFYNSNQWAGTFTGQAFQLDTKLSPKFLKEGTSFGFGLSAAKQSSLSDQIESNIIGISFGYHKKIHRFIFHMGFTANWQQKHIQAYNFVFASQWTDAGFDFSLPNLEPNLSESESTFHLNSGLMLELYSPEIRFERIRAGLVANYMNQAVESFSGSVFHYRQTYLIHIDLDFWINKTFSIRPWLMNYSGQNASSFYWGTYLIIQGGKEKNTFQFKAGPAVRTTPYSSLLLTVGIEYRNWTMEARHAIYEEGIIPNYMNYNSMEFYISKAIFCTNKKHKNNCLTPASSKFRKKKK